MEYNYAAAHGYCPEGIMKRTVRMKVIEREPGILTIAECSALLLEAAPQIRAAMAIPLFCGIRDAELQRLDWRAVDMEGGSLVVGSSVSKFSQRRVIPIRENLRAWLKPLRKIGGPVLVGNREDRRLAEEAQMRVLMLDRSFQMFGREIRWARNSSPPWMKP